MAYSPLSEPMQWMAVLYDARCPLCEWATSWLAAKPQLVPIVFLPANSEAARQRFPDLDHEATLTDITVVGSDGSIFTNEKAWIACLWATASHRRAAERLASPRLMPMTRRFVALVSKYRPVTKCEDGTCHV